MRTGNQTESDVTILHNRLSSSVTDLIDVTQPPFVDALRLTPLKEQVEEYILNNNTNTK